MSPKTSDRLHLRRGISNQTYCGRRIVPGERPRPQEVRRDRISATRDDVTCKSCRAHSDILRTDA